MMEWALAILFGVAVLLLILSFFKTTSKADQQIEQVSLTFMGEVSQLQQQIRDIEIDAEITAQEAGILKASSKERLLLREVLDLHKRGYSSESIATKKQLSTYEIERLLAPYIKTKGERGKVANDI